MKLSKLKRHFFLYCGITALLVNPNIVKADVYKYVDENGRAYYTDRPDHKGFRLIIKTWKAWIYKERTKSVASALASEQRRKLFAQAIASAAQKYRIPNALLHAVITAESAYNPNAVSRTGAVGLMQLMPATAERYGVSDRTNPEANIHGGTRYLRDLLGMFKNDLSLAIAAYNAGENAVIKYGYQIPPYEETQTYVKRVLDYYSRYSKMM